MSEQASGTSDPDRPADGAFVVGKPHGVDGFVALHVRAGANRIESRQGQ